MVSDIKFQHKYEHIPTNDSISNHRNIPLPEYIPTEKYKLYHHILCNLIEHQQTIVVRIPFKQFARYEPFKDEIFGFLNSLPCIQSSIGNDIVINRSFYMMETLSRLKHDDLPPFFCTFEIHEYEYQNPFNPNKRGSKHRKKRSIPQKYNPRTK